MISSKEEDWFERHADPAAVFIVLLGFLARLWAASGIFLNPDEALHFRLANQPSMALAYRQSLTGLHPPFFILLLHFWRALGTSELWLRLPSVIAGTVFCWLFFKWLTLVAGRLAGFLGVMLLALLPPPIMLSAEVRQYALLLAFLAATLYFLERAFAENSAALMFASALFLCLALLTHYSAFLFAGALGVYGLLKIFAHPSFRPRANVIASWIVGQSGGLAVCLFLYKTHLSRHDFGDSQILQGWMNYLGRSSYFQPGRDNPFLFAVGHSFGVFQYIFGQLAVGIAMGLAFLAGLGIILRGQLLAEEAALSWRLAVLLTLPFALACAASFAHVYPYGGTRHVAFLIVPGMAGVSVALAGLATVGVREVVSTGSRSKGSSGAANPIWFRGIAIAAVILVACIAFGKARQPKMDRTDQSRAHMAAAIEFVQSKIVPSDLIFTDYETDLVIGHYLCHQQPISFEPAPANFEQFSCGGHRVVSRDFKGWMFSADNFTQEWQRFVQAYHLKPGDTVWIFQAGWDADLAERLQSQPQFHDLHFEAFGKNIKIFPMTVAQSPNSNR